MEVDEDQMSLLLMGDVWVPCQSSRVIHYNIYPIPSMYGWFLPTFGCFLMVNVGKYTMDGWYGLQHLLKNHP